jgi:hypothetical protein
MNKLEAFEAFFAGQEPFNDLGVLQLEQTYNWSIPETDRHWLKISKACGYRANVKLKRDLQSAWKNSHNDGNTRLDIAKWIIKDWGGIGANKPKTIERYAAEASLQSPKTPISGLASFSKVLAASDSDRYAIYDARVAVSLNAIQLLAGVREDGIALPYLPGRNKITGDSSVKPRRGFSSKEAFSRKTLCQSYGWKTMRRDDAYSAYLELLGAHSNYKVYEMEMALFAQAETLACMAIERLSQSGKLS